MTHPNTEQPPDGLLTCPFCYKWLGDHHRKEDCPRSQPADTSLDEILEDYANFKVWESKQDWEDGYDRKGNIANSRNIAKAKINRLLVEAKREIVKIAAQRAAEDDVYTLDAFAEDMNVYLDKLSNQLNEEG